MPVLVKYFLCQTRIDDIRVSSLSQGLLAKLLILVAFKCPRRINTLFVGSFREDFDWEAGVLRAGPGR